MHERFRNYLPRFFQCEEPHCGKYRRLYAASCEVLSNPAWSKDELAEVRRPVVLYQRNFYDFWMALPLNSQIPK